LSIGFSTMARFLRVAATAALVESLLCRGLDTDMQEAAAVIERLSAVPPNPGFVLNEIPLKRMRALLAQTLGDETAYRDYRDMASRVGYEGHMKWAEAMP
jgi:adenylate cyclase